MVRGREGGGGKWEKEREEEGCVRKEREGGREQEEGIRDGPCTGRKGRKIEMTEMESNSGRKKRRKE